MCCCPPINGWTDAKVAVVCVFSAVEILGSNPDPVDVGKSSLNYATVSPFNTLSSSLFTIGQIWKGHFILLVSVYCSKHSRYCAYKMCLFVPYDFQNKQLSYYFSTLPSWTLK